MALSSAVFDTANDDIDDGTTLKALRRRASSPGHVARSRLSVGDVRCVGRDDERAALARWLSDPSVGCVQIWGAAGMGKSALVRAAADDHVRARGSVVWIERVAVGSLAKLLVRLLDACGVASDAEDGVAVLLRRLHHVLAEQPNTVVIIDGADSCAGPVRDLSERWRGGDFPAVLVVVARRPSACEADERVEVRPLAGRNALRCAREHATNHGLPVASASAREALERVTAACAGHPLSIAIAVARLRTSDVDEVLAFLRRGSRAARERIAEAVAETYHDLGPAERRALMVLASTAELPVAPLAAHMMERVAGPGALDALYDAGVAWLRSGSRTLPDRVWVHDTFLQLARAEMEHTGAASEVALAAREATVAYCAALVDELGRARDGMGETLEAARPHLEAILEDERTVDATWARAALALDCALATALPARRVSFLTKALAGTAGDPVLALRVRLARSHALFRNNESRRALSEVRDGAALAERQGRSSGVALAAHIETMCLLHVGDFVGAETRSAEAVALAEAVDPGLAAEAWRVRGYLLHLESKLEHASACAERAIGLAQAFGDPRLVAYALVFRASLHLHAGDAAAAERTYLESLRAARRARESVQVGDSVRGLGCVRLALGDATRAVRLLKRADGMHRRVDNARQRAATLVYLGLALLCAGSTTCARDTLIEALDGRITRQHAVIGSAFLALVEWVDGRATEAEKALRCARGGLVDGSRLERAIVVVVEQAIASPTRTTPPPEGTTGFELSVIRRFVDEHARCGPRREGGASRRVAMSGAWFVAYDGELVSLERRVPLRRLLAALARAAHEGRGPLSATDLYEATWPTDHASKNVALNRVRVAIWSLRRFGLAGLESSRAGYWLEGASVVEDEQTPT